MPALEKPDWHLFSTVSTILGIVPLRTSLFYGAFRL